jgi:hypothetical protein
MDPAGAPHSSGPNCSLDILDGVCASLDDALLDPALHHLFADYEALDTPPAIAALTPLTSMDDMFAYLNTLEGQKVRSGRY